MNIFIVRTLQHIGTENRTLKHYSGSTELVFQIRNSWRNGKSFKKKLRNAIIEKLEKYDYYFFEIVT